ncbi:hypothetical protein BD779DRAFT_1560070 [Infundibulicybe gibba]|nr:hypothetical protein BD779DRAFT_1560070 [Infundibulicybe gibba]
MGSKHSKPSGPDNSAEVESGENTAEAKPTSSKPAPGPDDPTKVKPVNSKVLRGMLAAHLPLELVDEILGDVMYGPKICVSGDKPFRLSANDISNTNASKCCLIAPPLPGPSRLGEEGSSTKTRMIRFRISSHDQGWASELGEPGTTYQGAYSWFEAIILRPIFPRDGSREQLGSFLIERVERELALPSVDDLQQFGFTYGGGMTWMLQRNAKAKSTLTNHEIIWTKGGAFGNPGSGGGAGFVAALQKGDRVAVIARAMFPDWENHVESVQVDIYHD